MKKRSGYWTRAEVVEGLRLQLGEGGQVELAERLGISPQSMCDIFSKRRPTSVIPTAALEVLGLEAVEQLYRRKSKGGSK